MPTTLLTQLDHDHTQLLTSAIAASALRQWQTDDPALAPYPTWTHVQAATHDRTNPVRADHILAALARRAPTSHLAAQLLLGFLLPGTKALTNRLWWLTDPDDRAAATVAAVYERIRTYPYQRRPTKIAANILADARQHLTRTARTQLPNTTHLPLDEDTARLLPTVPAVPEPSAGEELLGLLRWAAATGALTADQARLIAASRLADIPCEVLGAQAGLCAHSLRRRRQRAEHALARAVADRDDSAGSPAAVPPEPPTRMARTREAPAPLARSA
jgi:hypothetical protein